MERAAKYSMAVKKRGQVFTQTGSDKTAAITRHKKLESILTSHFNSRKNRININRIHNKKKKMDYTLNQDEIMKPSC